MAVYIRLSKEDARSLDESESVSNQRALIEEYIKHMDDGDNYVIVDEYVDDGVSGTTDDERRRFQDMLADIKRGRINCVIVKDLARSFRNYSDQGFYLDDWFPRHNVRFISLFHQPLDSYREPQNMRSIAVPIQGVINENHCAETSDKVREVFDMKRRSGEHIGSFAVYGYQKDPNNRNAFVIDEEAAAVVRDIFNMFLDGMSKNAIVHHLNDHGILCPSLYKQERLGLKYRNPHITPGKKTLWCAVTVSKILKNRMYCGDMVQGRCRIKSYKIHIQEQVPEDQWYIVEHTHAPIIDREVYEKVQCLLMRDTRTAPGKIQPYLFGGFLRCGDCGKAMTRSQTGNTVYYYCRTYKDRSKKACTKHMIRHDDLEAAVLYAIQMQISLTVDCDGVLRQIGSSPTENKYIRGLTKLMEQKKRDLDKITWYKQEIYQDWKNGELSSSDYHAMKENYDNQTGELNRIIEKLKQEQKEDVNGFRVENQYVSMLRQHHNIETLTRDILIELIDQIKVFEGGNICVQFLFSDGRHQTGHIDS